MTDFEQRSLHFLSSIDTQLKILIEEIKKLQARNGELSGPVAERTASPGMEK